jgi:hypothetical protein
MAYNNSNYVPDPPFATVEALDNSKLKAFIHRKQTNKGVFWLVEPRKAYEGQDGKMKYTSNLSLAEWAVFTTELLPECRRIVYEARTQARSDANPVGRYTRARTQQSSSHRGEAPVEPPSNPVSFDDDDIPF